MTISLILQAIFGFAMSGAFTYLGQPKHIAGFAVMYGLFLSFGEVCLLWARIQCKGNID